MDPPSPSISVYTKPRWRAKVYSLKESGDWEDHGPGYAEIVDNASKLSDDTTVDNTTPVPPPSDNVGHLVFRNESQEEILLVDIALRYTGTNDSFRRNGTIITWESPATETEIAMSFQENQGCLDIWEGLCLYFRLPVDSTTIHCNNEQYPTATFEEDTFVHHSNQSENLQVTMENVDNENLLNADVNTTGNHSVVLTNSFPTPPVQSSLFSPMYESSSTYLSHINDSSIPSSTESGEEIRSLMHITYSNPEEADRVPRFRSSSSSSENELSQDSTTDYSHRLHSNSTPSYNDSTSEPLLPKPDLISINRIRKTITDLERDLLSSDKLIHFLLDKDAVYLRQLFLEVFNEAEDLHDDDIMVDFFYIADKLLQLNDNTIIDVLTSDGIFEGLIGALEYTPSSDTAVAAGVTEKKDYRSFLRTKCHFRQVVPIDDTDLLTRIHQNFRIQFLKDHVLSRNYSESTLAQLSSILTFNTNEICSKVLNNSTMLRDISNIIMNPTKESSPGTYVDDTQISGMDQSILPSSIDSTKELDNVITRKRRDALLFIQELVNIGRSKAVTLRTAFFRSMNERLNPVFSLLEKVIGDRNATVEELLTTFDIMIAFATNDTISLREYALSQKRHPPLPPRKLNNNTSAWSGSMGTNNNPLSGSASLLGVVNDNSSLSAYSDYPVTIDDGLSIRLHEKLDNLGLLRQSDWKQRIPKLKEYNVENRHLGEHGRLVENVNSVSSLLHKLVWRAVDDPDQGIQSTACDILRLILDFDPTMTFGHSTAITEIFFQHYMPWLVIPFTHNDLLEPLNNDPKVPMENLKVLLSSIIEPTPVAPSIHPDIQDKVVRRLANGFDSMGLESKVSKYSKATIADFVCWCYNAHLLRMKTVANRCSLYTNMLRLLRYREKLLIVQGVRILRTLIGLKDQLLNTEVIGKALLSPVAAALLLNAKRPNLVHSVVIELLDFVRNLSDSRQLMTYLKTNFQPLIEWAGIMSLSNYDQPKSNVNLSPTSSWASNDYYTSGNELHQNRMEDNSVYNSSSSYDGKTNDNQVLSNKYNDNIYNTVTTSRDDDLRSSKYFDDIDDDEVDEDNDEISNGSYLSLRRNELLLNSHNRTEPSLFSNSGSQVAKIQAVASGNIQISSSSVDNDRKRPRDEFDFDEDDAPSATSTSGKIGLRTLITVNRRSSINSTVNDQTIPLSTLSNIENVQISSVGSQERLRATENVSKDGPKSTDKEQDDTFIEPTEFFQNKQTKNDGDDDDDDLLFRKSSKTFTPELSSSSSSVTDTGIYRPSPLPTNKLTIGAWRTTPTPTTTATMMIRISTPEDNRSNSTTASVNLAPSAEETSPTDDNVLDESSINGPVTKRSRNEDA